MVAPLVAWLDSARPTRLAAPSLGILEAGRRYVDSLYVGPPALAMLAKATGDSKYLDWMNAFYWDVHGELFDKEAGLFYRDHRFIGAKSANGKKVIWSRGNGWAFAGLPRILENLPQDNPSRARYVELFKTMAASLAKRQSADGLWRSNLDDPDDFPMPETSGTGFFCYGLAWGIRNGLLDRESYSPVVEKAWAGLVRCVSDEGRVQWGQLVGAFPVSVQREHTHEYVTGTFLLAGSEVLRLAKAGLLAGLEAATPVSSAADPRPTSSLSQPDSWDGRVLGVLGHPAMKRATRTLTVSPTGAPSSVMPIAQTRSVAPPVRRCGPACTPGIARPGTTTRAWSPRFQPPFPACETMATFWPRPPAASARWTTFQAPDSLMNRLGAWTGSANIEAADPDHGRPQGDR